MSDALVGARRILRENDSPAFAVLVRSLGVALPLKTLVRYASRFGPRHVPELGARTLRVIDLALASEAGWCLRTWQFFDPKVQVTITMLAACHDDAIVVGIKTDRKPPRVSKDPAKRPVIGGWGLRAWTRDAARNRANAISWATDLRRAEDALTAPIIARPQPLPADARGDGLRALAVAEPFSLEARSVYADWLLERGDARGELVRLQCLFQATPALRHREATAPLVAREAELLAALSDEVLAPVASWARGSISGGMIGAIEIHAPELVAHLDAFHGAHPITDYGILVTTAAELASVAALPIADRGARVGLHKIGALGRLVPSAIASSPLMGKLSSLACFGFLDDEPEIARFTDTLVAPDLVHLTLQDLAISVAVLDGLARTTRLKTLRVSLPRWGDTTDLAGACTRLVATGLQSLDVDGWRAHRAAGIAGALATPGLASLAAGILDEELGRLLRGSPGHSTLETLDGRLYQDIDFASLFGSLPRLRAVRISALHPIATAERSAALVRALIDAPPTLRTVELHLIQVDPELAARLRARAALSLTGIAP